MLRRDLMGFIAAALAGFQMRAAAQESYAVFQVSPRILLSEDRLRLLRREYERNNERWRQLELLLRGGARFPEPAFAFALGFLASGDESFARAAYEAILNSNSPAQFAIVSDWCGESLSRTQQETLHQRLREVLAGPRPNATDVRGVRDLTLAAISIADDAAELSAQALRWVHQQWWPQVLARIQQGRMPVPHRDTLPLIEVMYSFQRALQLDLRESSPDFFRVYPIWHLLRHYPPSYAGGENDYRIPAFAGDGEPDIDDSISSRTAELAMVAMDSNAEESQYLQGWLLNPRFRMRSALGAPYEFFWCNPYQPSLSYFYLPLYQHLPAFQTLLARSSWEENAAWLGTVDGDLQVFTESGISVLKRESETRVLPVGPSSLVLQGTASPKDALHFIEVPECERVFWMGLEPSSRYTVEIDLEELTEADTSIGGVLELDISNRPGGGIAIRWQSPTPEASKESGEFNGEV